jgi:hypothetical protein
MGNETGNEPELPPIRETVRLYLRKPGSAAVKDLGEAGLYNDAIRGCTVRFHITPTVSDPREVATATVTLVERRPDGTVTVYAELSPGSPDAHP